MSVRNQMSVLFCALAALLLPTGPSHTQSSSVPHLSEYMDQYPFDAVQGMSFLNHPVVRRAVENAAPTDRIRARILEPGVAGPIAMSSLFILSSACEAHNCGSHNWSILIGRTVPVHVVCYKLEGRNAVWYRHGRQILSGSGRCPHELENVPSEILGSI